MLLRTEAPGGLAHAIRRVPVPRKRPRIGTGRHCLAVVTHRRSHGAPAPLLGRRTNLRCVNAMCAQRWARTRCHIGGEPIACLGRIYRL